MGAAMNPSARSPEEVLAHSAWMRRLAFDLVREPGAAEDVVQKAWLVALERGPEAGGSLRAWLAGVVRHLSSKERRARARRTRREERGARPEATPATDDVVARLELHQQALDALHALAEPYRRTLSLRYLDGLDGAEIARREGVPPGTVRWRLAEGLARMRAELDRRHHGDRSAWLGAWIPIVVGGTPRVLARPPLGLALPGVLLMNVQAKLVVSLVLVVAASAGVWWWREGARGASVADATASPEAAPVVLTASASASPEPALEPELSATSDRERRALAPEPTAAVPAPARTLLRARVLDATRHPLADARVSLQERVAGSSAADGTVELEWPAGSGTQGLVAEFALAGFATRWLEVDLERAKTTSLGDVVLEPGATLAGLVLGPDGLPQAGADVSVTGVEFVGPQELAVRRGPVTHPGAPRARTDGEGRFRVEGVEPGTRRVWAGATRMRFCWSAPIEIAAGEEKAGIELTLAAQTESDTIEGVVLDPAGDPFPAAYLLFSFDSPSWTSTTRVNLESDGSFQKLVELAGPHDLRATDPRGRWPQASALGVLPGARDVVLQFREPSWLSVEVRARAGEPIAEFSLSALRPDAVSIPLARIERGAPGTARVPVPAEPFELLAAAPGFGAARSETLDPAALPASVRLVLDPRPGFSGVVVFEGAPVRGARVLLHALPKRGRTYDLDGVRLRVRPSASATATTGADGSFTLTPGDAGEYLILVDADGYAVAERGPLALGEGAGVAGLEIALDRGGVIEGRVRMPSELSPEGVIVAVNRGDTLARTQRVGADGEFRFEALAAGAWQVRRVERMIGSSHVFAITALDAPFEPDCRVELGGVTHHDLDLSDARPCVVAGELVWGGRPARGWTVALWPASGVVLGNPPASVLDERGAFTVSSAEPGAFRLQFRPPTGLGEWSVPIDGVRGANAFHRDVATATLVVRRPSAEGGELQLDQEGEATFLAALPAGATTTLELPCGAIAIGRYEQQGGLELSRWDETLALTLAPGERREIELP